MYYRRARDIRGGRRREDIAVLLDHCWHEATGLSGVARCRSTATIAALARYDWPGNVRELRNVRAALVRRDGHRARAAQELGVTSQGLTKLMTRLGIMESSA